MPDLYQELCKLADSEMYPFHMPGHKRNLESTPMKGAFRCDITEIDDFDNLHDASGIILEAQKRANELYGAEETFFLVNGSTSGVLTALSSAVNENDTILAARGSHKSFYHGAYLRHLDVKYIPYKLNTEYDIPEAYTAEDVEKVLTDDIKAVFITSPTYEGKCSDIRGIAEICHKRGIPLIVDAAHGAHFLRSQDRFLIEQNNQDIDGDARDSNKSILCREYRSIPESAIAQGADIVIHSVHKTLPSMTQTALLHVQGKIVDRDRVKRFLRIFQSSSPSYVLMSSIDLCVQEMLNNKEEFLQKLIKFRNRIQKETSGCRCLKVPGPEEIDDAAKVLISVKNAAMTGQELYDILREEYKLQLEMAGEKYVLAIISGWDKEDGITRLISAINDIDARLADVNCNSNISNNTNELDCLVNNPVSVMDLPQKELSLTKAWDAENEKVDLSDSVGRVAGEFVNLYPPGIPIIVPGEVFSEGVIAKIGSYLKDGLNVQGIYNRKEVICVRQK